MSAVGGTGLALPLNLALPVKGFVDVAARAEAAGYDRLWVAEAGNNDAEILAVEGLKYLKSLEGSSTE